MLARAVPSLLAGVAACGLLLALAWDEGGYFPESHLVAGAAAYGVLALVLPFRPVEQGLSTPALAAVAALAGLTLWTALSSYWSSAPDTALEDFQRDLVLLGLFGLGLAAAGSGRYSRHLVWAVLGVALAVAIAGLVSRLYPDWISDPGFPSRFVGYRLAYPLGYWNSFGAMGAMAVVVGAGLAADPRSPIVVRSVAAAGVVLAGVAAYLSFSRGAWLAFFVGLAVLALVFRPRVSLFATLAICGLALAVAIGRLGSYPALTQDPTLGEGQLAAGHGYAPFVISLAILAAVAQAVVSGRWLPRHVREQAVRAARPLGYAVGVLILLAGVGLYVVRASDVERNSAARLISVENWVDRQWDEFMTPAATSGLSPTERLTTARGTRSDLYRVAIDAFEADPLRGDGSGGFEVRFAHDRDVSEKVRDAHSLYLETLGELGIPGIALLLAFIGCAAWAAVVARRREDVLSPGQTAAAAAGFAVWASHAAVDWDWQVPAFTGAAVVLAAALFPRGRRGRRRSRRRDRAGAVH